MESATDLRSAATLDHQIPCRHFAATETIITSANNNNPLIYIE